MINNKRWLQNFIIWGFLLVKTIFDKRLTFYIGYSINIKAISF